MRELFSWNGDQEVTRENQRRIKSGECYGAQVETNKRLNPIKRINEHY